MWSKRDPSGRPAATSIHDVGSTPHQMVILCNARPVKNCRGSQPIENTLRNIEIKAGVDRLHLREIARRAMTLATQPPQRLKQTDTFFHVSGGRLKLREFSHGSAELIAYRRPDQGAPQLSEYIRVMTDGVDELKAALEMTLGIRAVVNKARDLYLIGQTRVHLDRVLRLGTFVELEYVLHPDQPESDGRQEIDRLMKEFNIDSRTLISLAYVDLLDAIPS